MTTDTLFYGLGENLFKIKNHKNIPYRQLKTVYSFKSLS